MMLDRRKVMMGAVTLIGGAALMHPATQVLAMEKLPMVRWQTWPLDAVNPDELGRYCEGTCDISSFIKTMKPTLEKIGFNVYWYELDHIPT